MAKQTINLGTAPTGTGGDTPRTAFTKAQGNFDEIYGALGASGSPLEIPATLPVSKGGTGNTTGKATNLAAAAILGTVSQSGGVPTGALMEAGSTANGRYYKYACGMLICVYVNMMSRAVNVGYRGAFADTGGIASVTFPVVFVSQPAIHIEVNGLNGPTFIGYESMTVTD